MKYSRSKLLSAIANIRNSYALDADSDWAAVVEAAEAYAPSMPKEIDVWDVEYAYKMEGAWYPMISRYSTESSAAALADSVRRRDEVREIKIIKRTAEVPQ